MTSTASISGADGSAVINALAGALEWRGIGPFRAGRVVAVAGDPSQRDKARPRVTKQEIEQNIKTWKKQAQKILDFSKVKIVHDGDWLLKLGLADLLSIASIVSAARLFQRDMFHRR